jgi:hypothetical protein
MKRILLAAGLLAPLTAHAAEPATVIMPMPVISAVAQYLSQRPYAEVAQMIAALQGCVAVQVPNAVTHGECPAVAAALAQKTTPAPDQR